MKINLHSVQIYMKRKKEKLLESIELLLQQVLEVKRMKFPSGLPKLETISSDLCTSSYLLINSQSLSSNFRAFLMKVLLPRIIDIILQSLLELQWDKDETCGWGGWVWSPFKSWSRTPELTSYAPWDSQKQSMDIT